MLNGRMIISLVGGFSEYCEYFANFGWKLYQQYINYQPSSNECWPSCNGITHWLTLDKQDCWSRRRGGSFGWNIAQPLIIARHENNFAHFCKVPCGQSWVYLPLGQSSVSNAKRDTAGRVFPALFVLVKYVALNQEQGWALTISLNTNYPDTQIRSEWL